LDSAGFAFRGDQDYLEMTASVSVQAKSKYSTGPKENIIGAAPGTVLI
jgi:hypothetical protein